MSDKDYKNFYELDIWQQGFSALQLVDKTTLSFPKVELYSLSSQLRRSANSIIANIAESHGRYNYKDKIRVLYIARGELNETLSHLTIALARKYIDKETFRILNNKYVKISTGINNYISSLNKKNFGIAKTNQTKN